MWEQKAVGSVWLLANIPWWLAFLGIVICSTGVVLLLRWITEGEIYDESWSSMPGDMYLAGYCCLVSYLLRQDLPAGLHLVPAWHVLVAFAMGLIGGSLHYLYLRQGGDSRRWNMLPTQWYHNLVVVPLLGYIIVSTLPVLWYGNYPRLQLAALGCLLVWAALVAWDIKHGRLVQKKPGKWNSRSPWLN